MEQDIRLLQQIVQIDSSNPPGNELNVARVLANRCDEMGISYKMSHVEPNRSNFELALKGKGNDSGKLIFCGHMDTVLPGEQTWDYAPFSGKIVEDKLYGRGASDMKSGLVAMFLAVESLIKERQQLDKDIVFLATVGEEVDSCGAQKYLQEQTMEGIDALVIAEPTNEKVAVGHKGALWLEIVTKGKTSHGSMPERGINAVEWMQKVMNMIESLKSKWKLSVDPLGESSVAITQVHGGFQTNVIPDQCRLHVDIRSIPPQSHNDLIADLKQNMHQLFSVKHAPVYSINKLLDRPAILTEKTNPLITTALDITGEKEVYGVPYYTDGAILNPQSKIPTLIYGPGDEKLAHQPNEYVNVNAYLRSIEFYKELASKYANM